MTTLQYLKECITDEEKFNELRRNRTFRWTMNALLWGLLIGYIIGSHARR